ncbi:hypothetical protein V8E52_004095 [Russula decolorans]
MGFRSYNSYNPNAQPNFSTSGPPSHSQGGNGSSYPPPGYLPSPAHGPSQSDPPPPDDRTGRYPPPGHFPFPAHGPSRSGPPPPDDRTGRCYPPPGHLPFPAHGPSTHDPGPLQNRPPPPNDSTGRCYPPRYPDPSQSRPAPPAPGPTRSRPPPSDPSPPNDGKGRHSGLSLSSSRYSDLLSPRRLTGLLSSSTMQYLLGQQVQVNITSNRWVVGVIVGLVYLAEQITGSKYRVEFECGGRQTGEFSHEQMTPYRPGA